MDKQISLSYLSDELAQVRTKKKEFLARIEQIIPWGEWETMIQPYYYKGERGNKSYGLNLMLHLHILQNLYGEREEAYRREYTSEQHFRRSVEEYIRFYNEVRPYQTLNYKTPQAFEEDYRSRFIGK